MAKGEKRGKEKREKVKRQGFGSSVLFVLRVQSRMTEERPSRAGVLTSNFSRSK
jgi:hypothetical protein